MSRSGDEFLGGLNADDVGELERCGQRRRFPPRTRVFEEGDPAHEVLILARGAVKLTRVSPEGREIVIAVRGDGAVVGELSAIDGGVRSAAATTIGAVELLSVPFDEFSRLLDTRASIARALLDVLAERLRDSTERVLEFGTADALTRVSRRLVELVEVSSDEPADGMMLDLALTQQELASLSGLSREATVKALRTLRTLGWIDVQRRRVTVHDVAALRDRARG